MTTIQDYVVQGSLSLTAGEIRAFRQKVPTYKLHAETLADKSQNDLREQCLFLIEFAEDVLDGVFVSDDLTAVSEAIFGVRYIVKGVDIIPDTVPGMGYQDDIAVIQVVLRGHAAEFRRYAQERKVALPPGM